MKMYRTRVVAEVDIAVEAESLGEAYRIIEGVLENATEIVIKEAYDDELIGGTNISCRHGSIQAER